MSNYIVSTSPHITSRDTTRRIMLDVIIALAPAVLATMLIFGFYSLFLVALSVGSCVLFEYLFNLIRKKEQSVNDLSAVVTGIILGLNLPASVPIWVPIIGSAFAIIIVKMLFGGIGKNFANPAMTARIFLMLAWGGLMLQKTLPVDLSNAGSFFGGFLNAVSINPVDAVASASPLGNVKAAAELGISPASSLDGLAMFLGTTPSSAMGETSALAILIGAVYLIVRKVIDWRIPALYIGSTVVFTALFFCTSPYVGEYVWSYLLGGGLLFGAFFMATDYATSPKSTLAVAIYGLGLGLLTVVFRKYGSMNEGVSFAILFMNILTPLLSKIKVKAFGTPKKDYVKIIKSKNEERKAKKAAPAEGGQNG